MALPRRGQLATVAIYASSRGLAFVLTMLIARLPDHDLSGLIFFMLGLIAFGGPLVSLGLGNSAIFYFPRNVRRGRPHRNRELYYLAVPISIATAMPFALYGLTVEAIRTSPLGVWILVTLYVGVLLAGLRQTARGMFLANGHAAESVVHETLLFNILLVVPLIAASTDASATVLAGLVFASVVSGVFAVLRVASLTPRSARALPPWRYAKRAMSVALHSLVSQGMAQILNRLDVLVLAPIASLEAVSFFSVAMRLTYLVSAVPEVMSLLYADRINKLTLGGAQRESARALFLRSVSVSTVLTVAIAVPLMVAGEPILTLVFGPAYAAAAPVFRVLLAGKVLTACFGPSVMLMTALGYNASLARLSVIAGVVNIVLAVTLSPALGAMGAAIATAVSLLLLAANIAYLAVRHLDLPASRTVRS